MSNRRNSSKHLPGVDCVVKVGGGRGFVIEHRVKVRRGPKSLNGSLRLRKYITRRLVLTAAHCLPEIPVAHAAADISDRTFKLLGRLGSDESTIWATCLFADPINDIAVLGAPDEQVLDGEADAFEDLIKNSSVLGIGRVQSGSGWVLALDGDWIPTRLDVHHSMWGISLSIDPAEAGMSGSPILNSVGRAVGIAVIGSETVNEAGERTNNRAGPQAILSQALPGWLLS